MFVRVFESILDSSINLQRIPPSVRWLWITMLIIADSSRTGVVDMPVERLAAKAGLSVEDTRAGLAILSAPDTESTSPDEGGRRLIPIREDSSRGWKLVNWDHYRNIASQEQQREKTRQRVADFRRKRSGEPVTHSNDQVTESNTPYTDASSDSKTEADAGEPLSFDDLWNEYPKKRGKEEAKQGYLRTVLNHADALALRGAIENLKSEIAIHQTPEKFIMQGPRFFGGEWRDFASGTWTAPKSPPPKEEPKPKYIPRNKPL